MAGRFELPAVVLLTEGGIMGKVISRIKEPSTWAGIAALASLAGVPIEHVNAVSGVLAAVAAALAVFMPEVEKK